RLPAKALHLLLIRIQTAVQDLQGHDAAQRRVPRLPDSAERSLTDALQELEATQRTADTGGVGEAGLADTEAAAAAGTEHLLARRIGQVNRILTVRTAQRAAAARGQ